MPDKAQDWSLANDDAGNVILILGDGRRENLGPREEAFVRFADFMGDND
jgi:hypothetical protein